MKKLLLTTILVSLLCLGLFAQAITYTQKVVLDNGDHPEEITNISNDSTHPNYLVEAYLANADGTPLGFNMSTDPASPNWTSPLNLRIKKFSATNINRVTQINYLAFNAFASTLDYQNKRIYLKVTYLPNGESTEWWHADIVVPGNWNVLDPAIVIPPFSSGPEEYTLEILSNYVGAAIWKDGVETGQVTPYEFYPAEAGLYTVVLPNVAWTPESYDYLGGFDASVTFVGVLNPSVPAITHPGNNQVFDWEAAGEISIMWTAGAIMPAYYEVQWNGGDWMNVGMINEWTTPEIGEGNYNFKVRGVIVDPAKAYTRARIDSRSVNTNAVKGTGDYAEVNFSVTITPPVEYDIDPGVPAVIGDSEITIVGPGFLGANIGAPETNVPNPNFITTSAGVLTLIGSGLVDVTLDFDPAIDWLVYWLGGVETVIAGPLTTYTIVGIDLGAKDATLEFKGGTGGDPTLPVELSVFNAVLTAQKFVKLTWISESESNMLGYRVYRSQLNDANTAVQITASMIEATNTSTTAVYSIEDREVAPFNSYYYWLEAVDFNHSSFFGPQYVTVTGEIVPELPVQTAMKNAYPNPFKANGNTNIEVALKAGETGTVTIYNVLGQVVKTYSVNEGINNLTWNGRDSKNNACGSGIYFYKLSTPSMNQTKKMVIVK
jgi:hypothetical protein